MSDLVLKCTNVSHEFKDGKNIVSVLNNVDFNVCQGQSVAIIGASGAGKSTLLQLLGGLDKATSGQVELMGEDFGKLSPNKRGLLRNKHLGFVYQFHHLLPEFSALENVMMPLLIAKLTKRQAKIQATQVLTTVGLEHRLTHRPAQLSGGERQRAAIARALVTQPNCLLADEPTGNLDEKTASAVLELMISLKNESNNALVIVTHDLELAKKMDFTYELKEGKLHLLS